MQYPMQYPMRLMVDREGVWHASFPDVPIVQVWGTSAEAARENGSELLFRTLILILETAERVPRPSPVTVGLHGISLPHHLVRRIKVGGGFQRVGIRSREIRFW